MINFSKLFTLSVFAAMTTAAIAQLGQDYCTQSPDTGCYANGQPECCSDASSDCPEEKPPCDVTPSPTPSPTSVPVPLPGSDYCTFSPAPDCYENNGKPECCLNDSIDCPDEQPPCDVTPSPTPSPTSAPVPLPGSDYCTFSPDPTCYENNGKPECCLNDSIDCPDEQPPCNVTPSPTPSPTSAPVPLPGSDYCTFSPDPTCYANNGKPECCLNDSIDCPDEQPPCNVTPSPTPLPSPGLTKPPTPLPTNSPSRRQTLEPTNSPTNRCVNIFKQCMLLRFI
jgi:type VI secretion system secreted protein VgrG